MDVCEGFLVVCRLDICPLGHCLQSDVGATSRSDHFSVEIRSF